MAQITNHVDEIPESDNTLDIGSALKRFKALYSGEIFSSNISVAGSISLPCVAKTADYTLTDADYTVAVTCSSVNITITLPVVAGCIGRVYNIKKMDATAYTVIVDGAGSETIDGDETQILSGQYDSLQIQSDGTSGWIII